MNLKNLNLLSPALLGALLFCGSTFSGEPGPPAAGKVAFSTSLTKPEPVTMAELAMKKQEGVSAIEVSDYVFGNYRGDFASPPHADLNPRKAFIVVWKEFPFRFVFCHEGSYCPWFELPSGAGVCYQFFEGNDGWAELFNNWGRQERNSFVDISNLARSGFGFAGPILESIWLPANPLTAPRKISGLTPMA